MSSHKLLKPDKDYAWKKPSKKKMELENPTEPDLLRKLFPYTEIPRQAYDTKSVPLDPPDKIWITDTTFRDGQQARPPYTVKQIVDIYDMLHRLGGPKGIIRQCEFFLYSDKDKEAVNKCLEKGYKYPEVTGWIRAVAKDFEIVKSMGLKETGILTSASDYHTFLKLKGDRKKALNGYLDLVKMAIDTGVRPRCHLEDITRADIYGFIIPFAQELMKIAKKNKVPVKIRLCDTMGYGLPYPEAALPRGVPKLVQALTKIAGVPKEWLEWHGHNDFHKVLVNGTAAWLYGCSALNAALLGFGERCGNPPLEAACIEYASIVGHTDGMDLTVITEIAEYFENEIDYKIPPNYPFVGENFNVTGAGIHADGFIKNEEIYNIFDTKKILNRPIGIILTDKSGVAGVSFWVNSYLGIEGDDRLEKHHPGILKINDRIQKEYDKGRTTSISQEEVIVLARKYLPEYFRSDYDELKEKAEIHAIQLIEEVVEKKEIKSMDPVKQEALLQDVVEDNHFIQYAYVTNTEGHNITKIITQKEYKEEFEKTGIDKVDFSSREWFIAPMKDGKIYISDFYISLITKKLCITVSAPVVVNDKITGILGFDMRFEELAKLEIQN